MASAGLIHLPTFCLGLGGVSWKAHCGFVCCLVSGCFSICFGFSYCMTNPWYLVKGSDRVRQLKGKGNRFHLLIGEVRHNLWSSFICWKLNEVKLENISSSFFLSWVEIAPGVLTSLPFGHVTECALEMGH